MSLGSRVSTKRGGNTPSAPQTKVKKIQWESVRPGEGEDKKFGKNISLLGGPTSGKSVLMLSHAFYNSEYLESIKHAGIFPNVVKCLKLGSLPEINDIVVLESENNLQKALYTKGTTENTLFKPFMDKKIIEIIPYIIQDDGKIIRDGKIIDVSRENFGEIKQEIKDMIRKLVDKGTENTLFCIDSGTKFKNVLDRGLKFMVDTIQNKKHAHLDGIDKFSQLFYTERNNEWEDIYEYKRGYRGWNIDTFKEKNTPKWVLKKDPTAKEISTKWVGGTAHFMDMVWRVVKNSDNSRTITLVDGRNIPTEADRLKPFPMPLENRFAAMPLLDRMCEKVVEYGEADDNRFWQL